MFPIDSCGVVPCCNENSRHYKRFYQQQPLSGKADDGTLFRAFLEKQADGGFSATQDLLPDNDPNRMFLTQKRHTDHYTKSTACGK